ncbi:MAG: NAD(P)-dependent alcohol dehydrogenase [Anaerolineaceae bacterium]|nr:NAD(P)-dependent alcohol dehydrogenase [Anaerolineaceae bacterium]
MKAIVYDTYGSPDVLRLADVAKPAPGDDEVLIKVHAAALNSWDWDRLTGKPYVYRLLFGLLKPKLPILGADVAGTVEAVGRNVKQFQPGDAVFGDLCEGGWGGLAEYVCAPETALTLKPAGMAFEQAAATPQAAVLALQGLRDKRPVQPGQTVLINGAGGGVGTFAVQMAKVFGADVTGVDSPAKLAMLRSLGADHVIDYTQEDYTQTGRQYDLIVDVVARRSIADYKRALTPQGTFVVIGGSIATILQTATLGAWFSQSEGQQMSLLMHRPNKNLASIIALFESGQVIPVIDKDYPLPEAAEAIRYLGAGQAKGKVVVTVAGSGDKLI